MPSSHPLASSDSAQSIRDARRNLVLLCILAAIGTLLAGIIGLASTALTVRALQEADLAARALRLQIQADMMHDMMRGDVFAHAAGIEASEEDFEQHAREMEENLERLQQLPLPPALQPRIAEERAKLAAFAAASRALVTRHDRIPLPEMEAYNAHWAALEQPLDAIGDALQEVVSDAGSFGRRAQTLGLIGTAAALVLLVAAVTFAARRLSRNVLDTSLHLAEATEKAIQASRSRADFLASMSHEIRTPMTGVLGMVDLLGAENVSPAQRHAYVDALRSSGQHLLAVINDILDFTRIESGRLELEQVDFRLDEVLEQLRSLVHPLAMERGLAFTIDVAQPSPSALRGDPTRLRQILLNLASNGVKFTERGRVRVEVEHHREESGQWRLRFRVRDTGVGIDAEAMRELFTPFRQADQSISRRFGGSGLGLAISRRLVEAMGGTIGAESTPGQGSVFTFELVLPEGDESRVTAPTVHGMAIASRPKRILVAEDVAINREILRNGLERAGHEAVFACDGAEAVRLAESEPFDLVLMDVQMPVMDGIEATRRIRDLPGANAGVPILALTANVMAQERESYLAAGMDACLMKPIDWDQLFAAIDEHDPERPGEQARADAAVPAPLVDEATQATLVRLASLQHLKEWLQVGLAGYDAGCAALAQALDDPDKVAAEAHKIKGSAGTLGLARVRAAAADLEQAAGDGLASRAQVRALQQALAQTRDALRERGLL